MRSIKWLAFLAIAVSLWASETERRTILILGDSLAAGFGVDPEEAFPGLLQGRIDAAGLKYEIVNAGVSGDTTAGGLRRMDWLLRRKIDVLLIELGGNDGLRGIAPATTRTNLQAIIDRARAKYPHSKIVIAGMQMPPNMGEEYNTAFRRIFPEVAKANKAALVPFLLEGVGGKPEFNLPDQIHPNPEGHRIVADNVWKVLEPLLRSTRRSHGKPAAFPAGVHESSKFQAPNKSQVPNPNGRQGIGTWDLELFWSLELGAFMDASPHSCCVPSQRVSH